ncbi:MAG TPA: hypothetical protein VFF65_01530, partial [Phycisphaerales bacterium]|nr:hypothetical protein [Phycisphaerales bacterium]
MTDAPRPLESAPAPATGGAVASRVDQMMEEASVALVQRRYFAAERIAAEALRATIAAEDFVRAARICMPLLEARRLKRQRAIDAGRIEVVSEPIPEGTELKPGCYIVC